LFIIAAPFSSVDTIQREKGAAAFAISINLPMHLTAAPGIYLAWFAAWHSQPFVSDTAMIQFAIGKCQYRKR